VPAEVGAAVRHVGARYNDNANAVEMLAYQLADLHAAWRARGVTVTGRVRNLFDRAYSAWGDPAYPGQLLLGAPRSVELALAWHR
jgi:iron complex outermembrane receptor protein